MRSLLVVMMVALALATITGCERRGGLQVGVTTGGSDSKPKPSPVVVVETPKNKLVTTTVTTSQKVEELVPPPPVKKVTITTGTETTATLNGVPVRPDVQVHETPKVIAPPVFDSAK